MKKLAFMTAVIAGFLGASVALLAASAPKQKAPPDPAACYDCHELIKDLREGSKHAGLSCSLCHGGIEEHLADSDNKPLTFIDQAVCGRCHRREMESFFTAAYESPARKEKGVPAGRSPLMDKLLAPYGFTYEHNEPRGHAFMVIDQFTVDRFVGGRFQFKKGWQGIAAPGRAWDVLADRGPDFRMAETGRAGNATCLMCKTTDHILKWKHLGEKDPQAKWDRTSDIVAMAKDTQNPMGCIHCHDPHAARPRLVRDALIEALSAGDGKNIFSGAKTGLKVLDFRGFRKIAILVRPDSRLLCGQCHVEYACGTGFNFSDDRPVRYDDGRTNHMPLRGPKEILAHYQDKQDFYDFRHAVTGARLVKLQHPEAETYAGSVHDKAAVGCADCHMPKVKGKKPFRTHAVVKPKLHVKESCLSCHKDSTAKEKLYQIEAIQNYVRGKMRKSEYWLGRLIDTYAAAKRRGVQGEVLQAARSAHEKAHVLWEWWTAENSDGFHNPALARETLAEAIAAAKEAVRLLDEAMDKADGKRQ